LRKFLEGLGFKYTRKPHCVMFEHAASDTVQLLRLYRANETVRPTDLAVVQTTLPYRGFVARDAFEQALRAVKA
jgi:hypothetical protein